MQLAMSLHLVRRAVPVVAIFCYRPHLTISTSLPLLPKSPVVISVNSRCRRTTLTLLLSNSPIIVCIVFSSPPPLSASASADL